MKKIFESLPVFFFANALIAVGALAIVYFFQYVLGFKPCILCVYERVPLIIISIVLPLAIVFARKYTAIYSFCSIILICCYASNFAISTYHVGVENGIFTMSEKCQNPEGSQEFMSAQELKEYLEQSRYTSCDKPSITVLGVSFAGLNLLFSAFMLFVNCIFLVKRANMLLLNNGKGEKGKNQKKQNKQ